VVLVLVIHTGEQLVLAVDGIADLNVAMALGSLLTSIGFDIDDGHQWHLLARSRQALRDLTDDPEMKSDNRQV